MCEKWQTGAVLPLVTLEKKKEVFEQMRLQTRCLKCARTRFMKAGVHVSPCGA